MLSKLDEDPELLKSVVLGHVIPNHALFYGRSELKSDQVYQSAARNGTLLRVNVYLKSKFFDVSIDLMYFYDIGHYFYIWCVSILLKFCHKLSYFL